MAPHKQKIILFLCTGNYYRSRFAEVLFNFVAGKMGLPWRASSRALALERGVNNIGPMDAEAIDTLKNLGVCIGGDCARPPTQATTESFTTAARIVALKQAEHQPLLLERFPDWSEKVEYWHIDDVPEALALIEKEVMALVARIVGGGERPQSTPADASTSARPVKKLPAAKPPTIKVGRETAGRRGKGVTTIFDTPLDDVRLKELATTLKQRCGTGGTVKDGRIEIQGDQRDRIIAELEKLGYKVKRVGG